jgi:hypothetical protein
MCCKCMCHLHFRIDAASQAVRRSSWGVIRTNTTASPSWAVSRHGMGQNGKIAEVLRMPQTLNRIGRFVGPVDEVAGMDGSNRPRG